MFIRVEHLPIPDSVVEFGDSCLGGCRRLRSVTIGTSSKLEHMCWCILLDEY